MKSNETIFHSGARIARRFLPNKVVSIIRSTITAFYTPIYFSYLTGHFSSSFKKKSVSKDGELIPWYTYPIIDFLRTRSFEERRVLEFGGGHSSIWWAQRAKEVVTFEGDEDWYGSIKAKIPSNGKLYLVSGTAREKCFEEVKKTLESYDHSTFDIVVIDGLFREDMIEFACKYVTMEGAIICDNAESYGFYEGFINKGFQRIDFYGHAAGVMLPHCTSLYFRGKNFMFDAQVPIPVRE